MAAWIHRVGVGLLLTTSTPAFASICISGGSFLAPEAGAMLPENPRLFWKLTYLYSEAYALLAP